MSDEEFQQAKRLCERHGYVVRRVGGVELSPGFVINPNHVASIQITGKVIRVNWAARDPEVFELANSDKAVEVAKLIRAHWD